TGKNPTPVFNPWVFGEGYPTFDLAWQQTGNHLLITSVQLRSAGSITPLLETVLAPNRVRGNGDTLIRVRQDQPSDFFTLNLSGSVSSIEIDPNQWILNKTGLIRQDAGLVSGMPEAQKTALLKLYPNPVTDFLAVSGADFQPEYFQIFDASGRCVKNQRTTGSFMPEINVSNLPAGFY